MYFVLQQTEVSDSLTWNPIDAAVICPIHEYFKIAPCMFRPNVIKINMRDLSMYSSFVKLFNFKRIYLLFFSGNQVNKYKTVLENNEKIEKERIEKRKKIKKEKNKVKQKLKRENDVLFQEKQKRLN